MSARDTFEQGAVRLAWHPEESLVVMRFNGPDAVASERDALGCLDAITRWSGASPFRLLVDCDGLGNTEAGWRATFSRFFAERGHRDRVAWCRLNPLIGMMVVMFVRATGTDGRSFRTEEDALAWLRARPLPEGGRA